MHVFNTGNIWTWLQNKISIIVFSCPEMTLFWKTLHCQNTIDEKGNSLLKRQSLLKVLDCELLTSHYPKILLIFYFYPMNVFELCHDQQKYLQ